MKYGPMMKLVRYSRLSHEYSFFRARGVDGMVTTRLVSKIRKVSKFRPNFKILNVKQSIKESFEIIGSGV